MLSNGLWSLKRYGEENQDLISEKQSLTFRFRNFSVSKLFDFFNGIGIGFGKFWYRKKYRYRFRKNLVSKKVSVSVSEKFGIEKSIGIGFENFWY